MEHLDRAATRLCLRAGGHHAIRQRESGLGLSEMVGHTDSPITVLYGSVLVASQLPGTRHPPPKLDGPKRGLVIHASNAIYKWNCKIVVKAEQKPPEGVCQRDLLARNWTDINKSSLDQFRWALRGVWKHLSLSETGQSTHCLQGAPCKLHDHPSANLGTEIPALNPCQWARGPSPKPVQR